MCYLKTRVKYIPLRHILIPWLADDQEHTMQVIGYLVQPQRIDLVSLLISVLCRLVLIMIVALIPGNIMIANGCL